VVPHAVPLTSLAGTEGEPALSPDGDHVAFVWDGESTGRFDLYVKLVGATQPLRLTEGPGQSSSPSWSPDGLEIAFVRDSGEAADVVVMPALGGPERKLSTTIGYFPGVDWSPDGETLGVVDRPSPRDASAIYLLSIATGDRRKLTTPPSAGGGDRNPAFSPDGLRIAFVRWWEGPVNDLYVTSVEGGDLQRLARHAGRIHDLDWTADGSAVVFAALWRGESGLWTVSSSGGQPSRLGFGENADSVSISTKGSRLVYSQRLSDVNIWRAGGPASSGGVPPTRLIASTRDDWSPQYSPDGSRIAFASARSGSQQIWICDADGSNCSQLTDAELASSPAWSPDGTHIAFGGQAGETVDVWTADVSRAVSQRLTDTQSFDFPESWSRDGRSLYFNSDRTGRYEVWRMPATGGDAEQLTYEGGFYPRESEDGRFVYYLKMTTPSTFWKKPTTGGPEELVCEQELTRPTLTLWRQHLVYVRHDADQGPVIESLDLETLEVSPVAVLGKRARIGKYGRLSVSPDGDWILYPQEDGTGSDLMLVEDYRD
jgi:Tol biopolymer transport system component